MSYFIFLTINLLAMLALCAGLLRRTRSVAFPFGFAVLYFWTFQGSWAIVTDLMGGDSQRNYMYLYDKMFSIHLDNDYAWTLGLYALFTWVIALTVLGWVRPATPNRLQVAPLEISHDRLLISCGIAAVASYWIIHDTLDAAINAGASGYMETRSTTDIGWFRLHQLLNRVALVPPAIGFATLFSSGGYRLLRGAVHLRHYFGYAVVLGFMFCFCVVLGNKNELAFALFSGCLFYMANSPRPRLRRLMLCGVSLLACVGFIDYARRFSIDEIVDNASIGEVAYSLVRIANSNESVAAHMSLYGILSHDVPLTYGSSALSLLGSVVPQSLWPDRPEDIYEYYVDGVGALEGQGYTVHHAAGWYLNFGIAGIVLGAFLLGRIWAALYNLAMHPRSPQATIAWQVFCTVGFFTFTASLPTIIRFGPEIFKSVLIETFLIPVATLSLVRLPSAVRRPAAVLHPALARANNT